MKDLAHHLKKLNRRVIRSAHREEMEEEQWDEPFSYPPPKRSYEMEAEVQEEIRKMKKKQTRPSPFAKKQTVSQLKKQAKRTVRKTRKKRAPTPKTPQEKNRLMKKRVPVFDRINNAKPKVGARRSKKKTARI